MYLIKSFTLENSNHTICTFDLFDKDGEPILIESALDSNDRVVRAYDGYEDVDERLWVLDLLCDGTAKADRAIHILQMFVKEFYGSK